MTYQIKTMIIETINLKEILREEQEVIEFIGVQLQFLDSPTLHIGILLLHIAIFQFIMELMEGICSF